MSTSHEHEAYGGRAPASRDGKCSPVAWLQCVCGREWGGHGVEMEPVGWETGYRSLGFSLGPSDVGKYEFHMLSRTFYVELKEEN